MLVCFGKDICRAVTDSHLANLPRDLILLRVSAAFPLRAVMFKPVLQSQRSARAVHGLPWWVIHGRCVRNWLRGKSHLLERGSSTKLGPNWDQNSLAEGRAPACNSPRCQGGCDGGLLAAPCLSHGLSPEEFMKD